DEDRRVPRRRDSRESPSPAVRRVEVRREKPRATGLRRSAGHPLDDPPALALQDRATAVRSRRRRERHRRAFAGEPFAGEPGALALIAGIVLAAGFARRMGRQKLLPAVRDAWRRTGKPIVAPVYHGTQGTPVLFSADVFAELRALSGDSGAKSIVQARRERVELVTIDAPMPADVDTPEDYARLHVE